METEVFWELGRVSDDQLRSGLAALLASGYRTEARIVAHIAEVEERRLHLKDGCASLFEYCVKQLGLSESEAFHRLTAARVARKFPAVFALLERREIHLTGVSLLRDYLTLENHQELLAEASHKTKLQIQELLARRFPRPDVASYVRKLPDAPRVEQSSVEREDRSTHASPAVEQPAPRLLQAPPAAPARARIEPTAEARYRIQLNASSSLKEKLELFQALLAIQSPVATSPRCSNARSIWLWSKSRNGASPGRTSRAFDRGRPRSNQSARTCTLEPRTLSAASTSRMPRSARSQLATVCAAPT